MKKVLFAVLLAMLSGQSLAIETPAHTIIKTIAEDIEIREYPEHVNAVTIVDGPPAEAGSSAFGRLAGYIFGTNREDKKIAMTAPVFQTALGNGRQAVAFFLPGTLAEQPAPIDERVSLESRSMKVAVVTYKGGWSASSYGNHLERLKDTLAGQSEWRVAGRPIWARYDPPFKPWFMRTNEIMIPVTRVEKQLRRGAVL